MRKAGRCGRRKGLGVGRGGGRTGRTGGDRRNFTRTQRVNSAQPTLPIQPTVNINSSEFTLVYNHFIFSKEFLIISQSCEYFVENMIAVFCRV